MHMVSQPMNIAPRSAAYCFVFSGTDAVQTMEEPHSLPSLASDLLFCFLCSSLNENSIFLPLQNPLDHYSFTNLASTPHQQPLSIALSQC